MDLPPEPVKPELSNAFDNFVLVDGLPIVDEAKHGKLVDFLKKSFGIYGTIVDLKVPIQGKSFGYVFHVCMA